MYVTWCNLV